MLRRKINVAYFEYSIVAHCNLKCVHCSQVAPHNPVFYQDFAAYRRDIEALAEVYHTRRLRILGGEPLLHKELESFIKFSRDSGFADEVGVCTNAKVLRRMPDSFFQAIDFLNISWYEASGPDEVLQFAREKCAEFDKPLRVDPVSSRTARWGIGHIDKRIDDDRLVEKIYLGCRNAHLNHNHTIHDGKYWKCAHVIFMKNYLEKLGTNVGDLFEGDGVPLHDNPNLKQELKDYRNSNTPLEACRYCLGSAGVRVKWHQLEKGEIERPVEQAGGDVRNLIDFKLLEKDVVLCNRYRHWPGFARARPLYLELRGKFKRLRKRMRSSTRAVSTTQQP
jgi:hypothetical protein